MSLTPARIKFPVIEDVSSFTMDACGRAIILSAKPIKPAVIDNKYPSPTHCKVQGIMLETGNPIELIITLPQLFALKARQVVFLEIGTEAPAPTGAVLDPLGRITNRRNQLTEE